MPQIHRRTEDGKYWIVHPDESLTEVLESEVPEHVLSAYRAALAKQSKPETTYTRISKWIEEVILRKHVSA